MNSSFHHDSRYCNKKQNLRGPSGVKRREWMSDTGCWILDTGFWIRDAGCKIGNAGCEIGDSGCEIRDAGCERITIDSVSSIQKPDTGLLMDQRHG